MNIAEILVTIIAGILVIAIAEIQVTIIAGILGHCHS
jgi:hypothetical protein